VSACRNYLPGTPGTPGGPAGPIIHPQCSSDDPEASGVDDDDPYWAPDVR